MENTNEMTLEMDSRSCNEGLARIHGGSICHPVKSHT